MAKLTLTDLANLQNETSAVGNINANNTNIETALENTLSRDGTDPNQMEADLDMNSNRILNLPLPVNATEPMRLRDVQDLVRIPSGGSTNEVLTKINDSDFNTYWSNAFTGTSFTGGNFTGTGITLTPTPGTSSMGIDIQQTGPTSGTTAGTVTNASAGNPALFYNQIFITNEGADVTGATVPKLTHGFNVAMLTGGMNSTGAKAAQSVFLYKPSASNPVQVRDHLAFSASGLIDAGDGGTGTALGQSKGTMFGAGFGSTARSGAINLFEIAGMEIDVGLLTGSSATYKFGINIVDNGDIQAVVQDAALAIGATGSSQGWNKGILFSSLNGHTPVSNTLILTDGAATITNGFDASSYTITNYFLKGPGGKFTVNGAGDRIKINGLDVILGNGTVTPYNNILDTSGSGAIVIGGGGTTPDPTTYYRNTTHQFAGVGGANAALTITSGATGIKFNAYGTGVITSNSTGVLSSSSTVSASLGGFGADVSAQSGVPLFAAGVPTFTGTSGTGNFARVTSPTFVTPTLGAATATTINKVTITAPATGSALTIDEGKTFRSANTITISGTDNTTLLFQGNDTYIGRTTTDTLTNKTFDTAGAGNSFSINGVAVTTNTGTGAVVRATSPTLVTPALGTPTALVLTNATGLPLSSGVTGTLPAGNGGTGDTGTAWTAYTPTMTAGSGTLTGTTITAAGRYKTLGKTTFIEGTITLTNVGSGTPGGLVGVSLPASGPTTSASAAVLKSMNSAAQGVNGYIPASDTRIQFYRYDGASLWTNGTVFYFSGVYEAT